MAREEASRPDERAGDGAPLAEIVRTVARDTGEVFRSEARLAGREMKEKGLESARAVPLLIGAGLAGFYAGVSLIVTFIAALAIVLPYWLSILLMAVMVGAGAGGGYVLGRLALEDVQPVPQETLETLKDNLDWSRNRLR